MISNGIIPAICAIFYLFTIEKIWLICYICGICEAFSDTVSSAFGAFSNRTFDLFKFKKCEAGISGGMSVYGTLSSLVAPILLATLGFFLDGFTLIHFIIIVACAFFGSVFDSFLGAIFQGKYQCTVCEKIVEKKIHCGKASKRISGFSFISNNVVNLLSNIFSVVACFLLYIIL